MLPPLIEPPCAVEPVDPPDVVPLVAVDPLAVVPVALPPVAEPPELLMLPVDVPVISTRWPTCFLRSDSCPSSMYDMPAPAVIVPDPLADPVEPDPADPVDPEPVVPEPVVPPPLAVLPDPAVPDVPDVDPVAPEPPPELIRVELPPEPLVMALARMNVPLREDPADALDVPVDPPLMVLPSCTHPVTVMVSLPPFFPVLPLCALLVCVCAPAATAKPALMATAIAAPA